MKGFAEIGQVIATIEAEPVEYTWCGGELCRQEQYTLFWRMAVKRPARSLLVVERHMRQVF